jgi:predicted nucleic acid-binding protein
VTFEFVDTNVLLYAYDPSAGERHERARELVGRLGRDRRGALSVQVLQEFYVNAVRKVAVPVAPADAQRRLRVLSHWRAHSPRPGDVIAAADLAERHRIAFWDAMIVNSAARLECSVLWTEDLNDGQKLAGVQVSNPFVRA